MAPQNTMKAITASEGTSRLVEAVARPAPCQKGWVTVKTAFAAICSTDVLILSGRFPATPGVIPGHRFSGVITEKGDGVQDCMIGDRVAVNPSTHCGHCKFCKKGKVENCMTGGIRSIFGMVRNGGFAEYVQVPASQVEVLGAGLTLKQAALCEPLSCILHSYSLCSEQLSTDSKVLVIGAGVVGIFCATLLRHRGIRNVIQTEPVPERRKFAKDINPNFKICHPEELTTLMADVDADVDGFDVVFDCSGDAKAFDQAFPMLARGATYLMFGVPPPNGRSNIPLADIVLKGVCIQGSIINPFKFSEGVKLMETFVQEKYFSLDSLGVVTLDFEDYKKGIDLMEGMSVTQVILKIGSEATKL